MSYTIEYNRKVFWWKDEDKNFNERNYLLLIRQGDNNVRDADTGLRSKSWDFIACGWEYQMWVKIGKRAGYTEGGGLQRAKGFESERISIEDYIALYRKAIKNAKPLEKIFSVFSVKFIIERKKVIQGEYESEKVNAALKKYKFKYAGRDYYYKDVKIYSLPITNTGDFIYCLGIPCGRYASDLYAHFYFEAHQIIRKSGGV
jgi:hypothetical protein